MQYLYLWINMLVLLGPLALSFDKKVAFYKSWKSLFISIAVMMLVFIPWDMAFTDIEVWGFNPKYLSGTRLGNLPIEEWMFFITVPYACTFIYACVKSYFEPDFALSFKKISVSFLIAVFTVIMLLGSDQYYSFYTSLCALVALLVMLRMNRGTAFWSTFFAGYIIAWIPFVVVNGILTGTGIHEQVVWYSSDHIFDIRIGTIPVEDSIYNFAMLAMTIGGYEFLEKRKG